MSIIAGTAIGAAGAVVGAGAAALTRKALDSDTSRPPHIYEYHVDNVWFENTDFYGRRPNAPLKGEEKADIVIIGGGYAGLASAWQLIQRYPQKRIVVIEGATCGYGASGRNGGHVMAGMHGLQAVCKKQGPEAARKLWDMTYHGSEIIQEMVEKHGIDCDFERNGKLVMAMDDRQAKALKNFKGLYDAMDLKSTWLTKDELRKEFNSPRFIEGWKEPYSAQINPAKLAFGMRDMVEKLGVEIFEQTRVMKVEEGKTVKVKTEFGEIEAPQIVVAVNGYAPHMGFFKNRIQTCTTNVIATEPLTDAQLESCVWQDRITWCDMRALAFDYCILSKDNRIVIGGDGLGVFYNDGVHTGPHKPLIEKIKASLFDTFPQLEGLKITHEWGGSMGLTTNMWPAMGSMGEHKNIFYLGGWNGEGVALSHVGGKVIADLVAGEKSEFTELPFVNKNFPYSGSDPVRLLGTKAYLKYLDKYGTNMLV